MGKPAIFFNTLPSCGRCKQIKPVVEQIARANGADFYEMDTKELHDPETVFLPAIYIYSADDVRTVFDGTETVGEMEAALGKTQASFLDNPFLDNFSNLNDTLMDYFDGVVEIGNSGEVLQVSYEDDIKAKERQIWIWIIVFIILLIAFSYLGAKFLK